MRSRCKFWLGVGVALLSGVAGIGQARVEAPSGFLPLDWPDSLGSATRTTLDPNHDRSAQRTLQESPEWRTFSAGGHVLGFEAEGYYVAGMDHALRVRFAGARVIEPQTPNPAESTATGKAPPLQKVSYLGLWPGVDLHYSPQGGLLQSLYRIAPGAEVSAIALDYNVPLQIQTDGSLRLAFERGALTESAPIAWQEIAGERVPVEIAFDARGEKRLGFRVGSYDPAQPLIIDPSLSWNTFLGGSGYDEGTSIAVDASGNVYIGGDSNASWGSPLRAYSGNKDAFVAKLSANGELLWNTFLGTSGSNDKGFAIAVDGGGNVYVAGESGKTWGSPVRAFSGGSDAFVAKLSANGTLLWNTFLGGSVSDDCGVSGCGIAVDASGNVYATGVSYATWGSPLRAFSGGTCPTLCSDAFVAQLDTNGSLLWNTFLGGSGSYDFGGAIALDGGGHAYVAGSSDASWGYPLGAFTPGGQSNSDVFVAQLDTNGSLLWNIFLGSSDVDQAYAIAVDSDDNVYVTGESDKTWGSPLRAYSGSGRDAFVAKINANGALLWNTFIGGSGTDCNKRCSIAVDGGGNVFVVGESDKTWGSPQRVHSGEDDAFVAKLDTNGTLLWNTFLGGSSWDQSYAIAAVNSGDNVFVAGISGATWGSPLEWFPGGTCGNWPYEFPCPHAFVAKLSVSSSTASTDFDGDGQADILWRNSATGENWLYRMDGANILQSVPVHSVPDQNWKIAGVGDFDGDGKADILWRNSVTGENWLYLMNGANLAESHPVNSVPDQNWKIDGVADFDGDGKADILWRNSATGENWLYLMDGPTIRTSTSINTVSDLNWKIAGVADFNGDRFADVLWRNSATGENWMYLMDGPNILENHHVNTVGNLNWKIVGVGDFNGDHKADILWRNSATGENWLYRMNGNNIQESHPINTVADLNWKIVLVGDFDGDGKADILWRNSASGENWLYLMDGATILESHPINTVADLNWKIQGGGGN